MYLITCGYWEVVDEVEHIVLYLNPGSSTLCLYYYAMLVDVVWFERFMTVVSIIMN